jgi:hypothetical protein
MVCIVHFQIYNSFISWLKVLKEVVNLFLLKIALIFSLKFKAFIQADRSRKRRIESKFRSSKTFNAKSRQ